MPRQVTDLFSPVLQKMERLHSEQSDSMKEILSTGLYTAGRYCISQATGYNSYSVSYPTCADPTLTDTLKVFSMPVIFWL